MQNSNFTTRAMRRAAKAEKRRELKAFLKATKNGCLVANENVNPLPRIEGSVCWSVEYGEASLNWNATPAETLELAQQAAEVLTRIGGDLRHLAREHVIDLVSQNLHSARPYADCVVSMASWLAVTSEIGELVAAGAYSSCGYLILPPQNSGQRAIVRFVAELKTKTNAANDNEVLH